METKHTKGKWKQKGLSIRCNNKIIANIDPLNGDYSIENEANSKLIAAAPELLEALILMADYYIHDKSIDDGDYIDMENKVINAINKATK